MRTTCLLTVRVVVVATRCQHQGVSQVSSPYATIVADNKFIDIQIDLMGNTLILNLKKHEHFFCLAHWSTCQIEYQIV